MDEIEERVKIRELITELLVHRVSVFIKDNESLNNAYENVGGIFKR
jgi:hypothetical protein